MRRDTLTGSVPAPVQRRDLTPAGLGETPEQAQLRARIERLRTDVTDAAAELEQLRATLAAFEARYEARVGVLIVQLDRVNLEISRVSRLLAALDESEGSWDRIEAEVDAELAEERQRIDREERDASGAGQRADAFAEQPTPDVRLAIREQYRKLARRFHPDVAVTEEQRAYNEAAMKRINQAMEANDLDALGTLEVSLPVRGDEIPGGPARAIIHWATAEIARLERILTSTAGKIAAVQASSIYDLWQRVERDPAILERLAHDISGEITVSRMQLHALQRELEERRVNHRAGANDRGRGG